MRKTTTFTLVTLLGVSAAAILVGAGPAQAATSATGSVSGSVVNAVGGAALKGICVNVIDASDNHTVGTSLPTGNAGSWHLKGLTPSTTYTATAYGCKNSNFVSQWYDGQDFQDQATQFTVAAGKPTTQIDFSLDEGGSLSGTVTDSATKAPVAGILVVAYWTTAQEVSTFAQCTTSSGIYKLHGVPASGAKVQFLPNDCGTTSTYQAIWYRNQTSYAAATVVPITAGALTKRVTKP